MTIDILAALRAAAAAPVSTPVGSSDILADLAALDGKRRQPSPQIASEAGDGPRRSLQLQIEARVEAANRKATCETERRMPWPEHWWAGTDSADVARCRTLWQEVLRQCLMSAIDVHLGAPIKANDATPAWIGSRDFAMVCDLAGFEPSAVAERLLARLREPNGAVALRRELVVAPRSSGDQE
ncbi:hypothetical protein [Limimaricola cinnabarinus]|uniref:Uncharacterized protein n=1 Tax=Limimaricola cinnabarinus TaxID=1125964 RepID=A0A2G1MGX6_9RHOB|nr:hypothetical protein [Limimaricola cinnabarinus]PHP28015.1 hypothetical protein CJ301_08505 [Limimaricola cinnabarinus]